MAVFDFLKDKREQKQNQVQDELRRLEEIPVESICPNPNQPRKTFDEEAIAELAESIRQVGLIQPLLVRRQGEGYELVAGERRLRACKSIGLEKVPCVVQSDIVEEDSAMMALVENLQRENLHYIEEAECYQALLNTYNLKQEELAARVGKSQSTIANKLRVLRLSPDVKAMLSEANLSERHARSLLRIPDEDAQKQIIEKVREKGLSVKDTEKLVEREIDRRSEKKVEGAKPRPKIVRMLRDYRLFMNTVNMAINQLRDTGIDVEVEQFEREDGVDITIRVNRN